MNINRLLKFLPVVLLTTTYTTFGMTIIRNNNISGCAYINNSVNNNSQTINITNNNISGNASVFNNISQPNNPIIFRGPMSYFQNMQPNYIWNTPYINQQSAIPVNFNYINLLHKAAQVNSQYQQSYKPNNIINVNKNKKENCKKNNNKVNNDKTQNYTPLNLNAIYNYKQNPDTYYIDKQFDSFNKKNNDILEEDIKEEDTPIESDNYMEEIDQQLAQIMGDGDIVSKCKIKLYEKKVKHKFLPILNELTKLKKIQNIIQAIENKRLVNNKEFFNKMKEINLIKRISDKIKCHQNNIAQERKNNQDIIKRILNNYVEQQFENELLNLKNQHDNIQSSDDILKFFDILLKLKKQISETKNKIKDNFLKKLNKCLINCKNISNEKNNLNHDFIYNIYKYLLESYNNNTNIKDQLCYYTAYHNSIIWRLKQYKILPLPFGNTIKEIIDIIINNYTKNNYTTNQFSNKNSKKLDNFHNRFMNLNNKYIKLLNKENIIISDFRSIQDKYENLYKDIQKSNTSFTEKDIILSNITELKNELVENIKILDKQKDNKKDAIKIQDISKKPANNIIINNYKNNTNTIGKQHNIKNSDNIKNPDYNNLYLSQAEKYQNILDKFDLNNKDEKYHISIINNNFISPIHKNIESNIKILNNLLTAQQQKPRESIRLNDKNKCIIYNNTLDICQKVKYFFKYYTKLSDNNLANEKIQLIFNKMYEVLCCYTNDFYSKIMHNYDGKKQSTENLLKSLQDLKVDSLQKLQDELKIEKNKTTNKLKNTPNFNSIEEFNTYKSKILTSINNLTIILKEIIDERINNNSNLIEFYSTYNKTIKDLKHKHDILSDDYIKLRNNIRMTKYSYYHIIKINVYELALQINSLFNYGFTNIDVLKHTSNELLQNLNIFKDRINIIKEQDIININKKK